MPHVNEYFTNHDIDIIRTAEWNDGWREGRKDGGRTDGNRLGEVPRRGLKRQTVISTI